MDPIRIMMLGPTQSGKTLYLSAMWQKLQWPLDPGFHLDVVTSDGKPSPEAKTRLDRIYNHLLTKPDFPPGTGLGSKVVFRFACLIRSAHGTYKACDFEYMDYAGGLLSQETIIDPEFERAVDSADVVLGLMDGVRLLLAMDNDQLARDWVAAELGPVLVSVVETMQRTGRTRPVSIHFAISKWDAVKTLAPSRTLKDFRDFLLSLSPIQRLLELASGNATIRLIPFSSLGQGYADVTMETIDTGMGTTRKVVHVRKRPESGQLRTPVPLNVEIPIACALPDVLVQRLAALAEEEQQIQQQLANASNSRIAVVGRQLQGIRLPLLKQLGGWLQRTQVDRQERLSFSLKGRHQSIQDAESALSYLVEFCTAIRDSFEQEEPYSILKRGVL